MPRTTPITVASRLEYPKVRAIVFDTDRDTGARSVYDIIEVDNTDKGMRALRRVITGYFHWDKTYTVLYEWNREASGPWEEGSQVAEDMTHKFVMRGD